MKTVFQVLSIFCLNIQFGIFHL